MFTWSNLQNDVFNFALNGTGHGIIKAVAGGAKSSTIIETFKRVIAANPRLNVLFLAFGKDIVTELEAKGVNAKTFNSLGFGPTMRYKRQREATLNKVQILCDENLSDDDNAMYGAFARKLVSLARQVGIGCLINDTEQAWFNLIDHHGLELESEHADYNRAVTIAAKLLQASYESSMVDFDDMLYIPVCAGLVMPKYDFIFIDENQDTNAIQHALLRKIMYPHTRVIAVGDDAQAIYGFRGAESDSMNIFKREFNATELPLSVSYRCAKNIVAFAKQWCPQIEAAPNAPDGSVETLAKWDANIFKVNDLVVCRTTAPLIDLAYKLLRAKVPMRMLGRDIGQGMRSLVNKMKAKGIDQLEKKLATWMERETEKAKVKKDDAKIQSITDKVSAIQVLIDSLPETERTIPALIKIIDDMFGGLDTKDAKDKQDKTPRVKLGTIHKVKGLEAETVYWLNRSQCPSKWAKKDWQKIQESNLCNVAATRAKLRLVMIEGETKESQA